MPQFKRTGPSWIADEVDIGLHQAIAVFDIGKTNLKLLAITPEGRVLEALGTPNRPRPGPPYLHADLAATEAWLLCSLGALARRHPIGAVVASGHGSGAVLVDEAGPVLPMMDYEAEAPDWLHPAYDAVVPAYDETFCATGPDAGRLAKQMLWQSREWPEAFARAQHCLTLPQYWAWRLSGEAASEVSALAAQTHLWNPRAGDFTRMVDRLGWRRLFPPIAPAWRGLGTLRPEVARASGLAPATEVLCGVHDSNANWYRYLAAGLGDIALLSTGTWIIGFNPGLPLERMDGRRAMVANVGVDGRPLASTLVMGGREYAVLAGEPPAAPTDADIAGLVAAGTMALPSFAGGDGAFPGSAGRGRIRGPAPADAAGRAALATLYTALVCRTCLDLLDARGTVVVDGGFAADPLFARTLAALLPGRPVRRSASRNGTAVGAALLWGHETRTAPVPVDLADAPPLDLPGLDRYAERWTDAAAGC